MKFIILTCTLPFLAFQQMGYRFSPTFVQNLLSKYDPRTKKLTLDNFIVASVQVKRLTGKLTFLIYFWHLKCQDRAQNNQLDLKIYTFMIVCFKLQLDLLFFLKHKLACQESHHPISDCFSFFRPNSPNGAVVMAL